MDTNIVNDITNIYFGQIAINEAKKPNDGNLANNYPPYDEVTYGDVVAGRLGKDQMGGRKRRRKITTEELKGNQHRIDANNNNQIDAGDFKILRRNKKKKLKESFSNWRSDLIEVMDVIEKEKNDKEITEDPNIKNKIKINPSMGEAVENLGGTLLEMTEIEDFEGVFDELSESDIFLLTDDLIEEVVQEVFEECLQEGYNLFEIENILLESLEISSMILTEAEVTQGHDTDIKKSRLERVKSAISKVGKGLARGAGYVAGAAVRGAKALGREFGSGYQRGRYGSGGGSQTSSSGSSGGGGSQTSSSGSSGSSGGGSATVTQGSGNSQASGSSRPGLLGRIASKLGRGLRRVIHGGAKAVERGAAAVAKRTAPPQSASQTTQSSSQNPTRPPSTTQVAPKSQAQTTQKPQAQAAPNSQQTDPEIIRKRRIHATARVWERHPNISTASLQRVADSIREAHYKLLEMSVSQNQQKLFGLALSVKRGETSRSEVSDAVLKIVDGMSQKEIRKFAKTSHEGLPKKVETKEEAIKDALIDRMTKKIVEQAYEPEGEMIDEAKITRQERRERNKGKKGYDAQGNPLPRESKTEVIHDVDDNLADQRHPNAAKIDLMQKIREEKKGDYKKVGELTPSQFAHHELTTDQEYGFDQFKSTDKFKTATPNKAVVRLGDSPRRPAQKEVITARSRMDKPKEFSKDLSTRIGVRNLKHKNVRYTGGMRQGSGPEKKGAVVKKIVNPDAKKVIVTDDHLTDNKGKPGNVRHMAAAASEAAPKAKVRAYQSRPATRAKGKVKPGDIVPVRVGKEGDLSDPKIGIRPDPSPPSSDRERQRRRKKRFWGRRRKKRSWGESYDDSGFRQHSVSITSSPNPSNNQSRTTSLMSKMRELGIMTPPKKKKKKKKVNPT